MSFFSKKISPYLAIVISLLLFRAYLNYSIPLMDKTEARYAEIARIMAETNDYTTLQYNYGVPFWAKPPLSTWLSALTIEIFGTNEFSVRLPYLLLSILMIFLVGKYAKREGLNFFIPGVILLTIPEFLIHAGVVSTDTALAFCVALVMLSFWEGINNAKNIIWKYLFFIGIGLGLLAKGPIILVLTAPPIFIWLILFKKFRILWKSFPWIIGIFLTLLIAVPWYYLAEQKTPGFIDYFIVGEHFKRFFSSGWQGDKYGFPKSQPLGMIWVFLFAFALPWIQILVYKLWKNKIGLLKNKWLMFLLLWLMWTPLFFTISKSLIHPYIMPVLIPVALIITHFWKEFKNIKKIIRVSIIFPVLALLFYVIISFSGKKEYYIKTDKYFVENNIDNLEIYHWIKECYSGRFYTEGKQKAIKNNDDLSKQFESKTPFYIIISDDEKDKISKENFNRLTYIESNYLKGIYLFKE